VLCALPVPAIPEAGRCRVHDNDIAGFELGVTLYDANRARIYDNLIDGAIALFGLGIVSISGKDLKTPPCFDNFVYATPRSDRTIKDCGTNNTVIGGVQVDTNQFPCD